MAIKTDSTNVANTLSSAKVLYSKNSTKSTTTKTDAALNVASNTNNKTSKTDKKQDFKEVLKSNGKASSKETVKVNDNVKDVNDDIKDKLEELEEKIDKASPDEIMEMLNAIINMLKKMQSNDDVSNVDIKDNNNTLNMILKALADDKSGKSNMNELLDSLKKLLNNDDIMSKIDTKSADVIEKLLTKLNDTVDKKSEVSSSINSLVEQLKNNVKESAVDKKSSVQEMINSRTVIENTTDNTEEKTTDDNLQNKQSTDSKDDEFLNKFLNKDNSNDKISMFSLRNNLVQNNTVSAPAANTVTDVNKVTLAKDLIQDVKFMVTNSIKELTVKVNPQNLGQITIKIAEENGIMKATLKANSKETTQLIAQNIAEIKKSLDEQNIKVADVNVELYQEDTTFFKDGEFNSEMHDEREKMLNKLQKSNENSSVENGENDGDTENDNGNVNFLA